MGRKTAVKRSTNKIQKKSPKKSTTAKFASLCNTMKNLPQIMGNILDYATKGSVGLDLKASEDVTINSGEIILIPTNTFIQPMEPRGAPTEINFFIIEGRSSMALKGLVPLGRVIDMDYIGEIKIIMVNMSKTPQAVQRGMAIAQLVCYRGYQIKPACEQTRMGGFGSTDIS